jgi:hypothetical protein
MTRSIAEPLDEYPRFVRLFQLFTPIGDQKHEILIVNGLCDRGLDGLIRSGLRREGLADHEHVVVALGVRVDQGIALIEILDAMVQVFRQGRHGQ